MRLSEVLVVAFRSWARRCVPSAPEPIPSPAPVQHRPPRLRRLRPRRRRRWQRQPWMDAPLTPGDWRYIGGLASLARRTRRRA